MTITVENHSRQTFDFPYEELAGQVITAVLDFEEFPYEAEVSLMLTELGEIHEINRVHRGIDRATDVLSFPMLEYPAPGDFSQMEESFGYFHPDTGEAMLGDIVLCVDKVKEQAMEYGHSVRREYAFLIVHSMLHLLGYDHMTEEEALVMEEKQEQILEVLKISR